MSSVEHRVICAGAELREERGAIREPNKGSKC